MRRRETGSAVAGTGASAARSIVSIFGAGGGDAIRFGVAVAGVNADADGFVAAADVCTSSSDGMFSAAATTASEILAAGTNSA